MTDDTNNSDQELQENKIQRLFSFGDQLNQKNDYQSPYKKVKLDSDLNQTIKICGNQSFQIYDFYKLNQIIGTGAFGIVCSGFDNRKQIQVGIKKIQKAFDDVRDSKRILREIKLLRFLNHENIIKLLDIIEPVDINNFNEVYLVFELMQTDLEKVINSRQVLNDDHVKCFLFQILKGIAYMHSADVIHRDLKPSNLLVNKNCGLKIGDLGLARKHENQDNQITDYVVTRWYRAPEIMLSKSTYSKSVDIWSVGCILAELIGRTPIFQGKHFLDQIERIIAILGTPKNEDLNYKIEQQTQLYLQSLKTRDKIGFDVLFPGANPLALDLMSKILIFSPEKRLTAIECLNHPYLESMMQKYPNIELCNNEFEWKFDSLYENKSDIQNAIINEAKTMH